MTDHYEMPHPNADACQHAGLGKACRPCREVQIGGAPGSRVYCQDPALGWVPTRPLLSGGTFGQL